MGKWLAAAAVIVIALLALLWLQIRTPSAEPVVAAKKASAPTLTPEQARLEELRKVTAHVAVAEQKSGKLDPRSDAFFYKFDEAVPPALTMEAAKCYTGGLRRVHRNAKVKLGYKITIKDGVLAISDVKVLESTVNDKQLEECFAREVAKVTWKDDELPDWAQDDELVIRPERGMKKFTAENLAYEGEGPIGKLESPGRHVAASRELPTEEQKSPFAE
jgi:hypothetical protein